jgi:hypothetical protein
LQELVKCGTQFPAQLQNAWFAALPVDRFQRARGIISEVSNSVRRQLGQLERAMFGSLRAIYDLSTEKQLEEFQTLDTALTSAAEWHPALHWYGLDRRVQRLRGLRLLQVAPRAHAHDPLEWESAPSWDGPRRESTAQYLWWSWQRVCNRYTRGVSVCLQLSATTITRSRRRCAETSYWRG